HGDLRDGEILAVQPDEVRRLAQLDPDRGRAGIVFLLRIDLEGQLVVFGLGPGRQMAEGRGGVRAGGERGATASGERSENERTDETTHDGWDSPVGNRPSCEQG